MCVGLMVGDSKNKKSEQEYENWWCQGKEIEKVSNVPPTVKVLWDAMLVDLEEDISTSNQVLQPNKCKKKSNLGGVWILMWSCLKTIMEQLTVMIMLRRQSMSISMTMTLMIIVLIVTVIVMMKRKGCLIMGLTVVRVKVTNGM